MCLMKIKELHRTGEREEQHARGDKKADIGVPQSDSRHVAMIITKIEGLLPASPIISRMLIFFQTSLALGGTSEACCNEQIPSEPRYFESRVCRTLCIQVL